MNRKPLLHLYPVEYEHSFDRKALDQLENTRGLDRITRKVLDAGLEKYLRIKHTGDNLKVIPSSLPELHDVLEEACHLLGMREVPELYIFLEDKIQSFTSGEKQPIILLSSGCIDLLTRDEILFMLGRELGHIKSNHVLYHMMAASVKTLAQFVSDVSLGIGNLISMPLQAALMHWHRMSEFTADRAGLLTCQDMNVAAQSLIKIAGLPIKYHGKVTVEDLRNQAQEFNGFDVGSFNKFLKFAAVYESEQPFTIIRANELFNWVESGQYERVLIRETQEQGTPEVCYNCGYPVLEEAYFCRMCGVQLNNPPAQPSPPDAQEDIPSPSSPE